MADWRLYEWFRRLALFASAFALVVVVLGAYTRLSDAGLGCPDWPGCYGQLTVPSNAGAIQSANTAFPQRPVEGHKAWKEMIHRYFAGTLGLLVLALAVIALRNRRYAHQPRWLPFTLLVLVIFQALLGMWTVTLQLKPLVVMGHLLGGFATLSLLWWLGVSDRLKADNGTRAVLPWAVVGVLILVMQIALGGWTSSNYAALACPDFPQCQSSWLPVMDFREGFVLWRGLGVNYEFGVLEQPARTAIHWMHRVGALITALYVAVLALSVALGGSSRVQRRVGMVLLLVLFAQIALGISNVVFQLPLPVAVAHNAVAAMLLLTLISLISVSRNAVSASSPLARG